MSNLKYLIDDKQCLECELDLLETYEKFKDYPVSSEEVGVGEIDYAEDAKNTGMTELKPIEITIGKRFLKKRIAWFEYEIEKETEKGE